MLIASAQNTLGNPHWILIHLSLLFKVLFIIFAILFCYIWCSLNRLDHFDLVL